MRVHFGIEWDSRERRVILVNEAKRYSSIGSRVHLYIRVLTTYTTSIFLNADGATLRNTYWINKNSLNTIDDNKFPTDI